MQRGHRNLLFWALVLVCVFLGFLVCAVAGRSVR